MCSVKVVLFAEVMGRSTGGLRPGGGRGVCRRLFSDAPEGGKADPGHFLRAMEAELRRRDTERWNFDFQKERPLPGRYQWVAMGGKQEGKTQELKCETTERVVEIVDEVVRPQKVSGSIPECGRRKSSGAGAATQAKITDFLRKRKRIEPGESKKLKVRRLSSNLAPSSSLASSAAARPT